MVLEQTFAIVNRHGLHARAASRFVLLASRFQAVIEVESNGRRANGKSVIGILGVFAASGDAITIRGRGTDVGDALLALGGLIRGGFGDSDWSSSPVARPAAPHRLV